MIYLFTFGEICVKDRVKNILKYKKTAIWVTMVTVGLCVTVAICFFISPEDEKNSVKKDGNVKQESTIQYNGHLYNKEDLSAKTVEWLEWYNGLSKGEQITISYVPFDLYKEEDFGNSSKTVDALDSEREEDKQNKVTGSFCTIMPAKLN